MDNWQTMESFPYPTEEWDFEAQRFLLFSEKKGIVIGRCILEDEETKEFHFTYDCEGWAIEPTHWMPLPNKPKEV